MKRMYLANKYTDEEFLNLKSGKCWCGISKENFQKGMRMYCSPEHRNIWRSKTLTWSEFRDDFLSKHGKYCDSCEKKDDSYDDLYVERNSEINELLREKYKEILEEKQIRALKKLDDWYNERYATIFKEDATKSDAEDYAKRHKIKIPDIPVSYDLKKYAYEVDHRVAIVNGGAEFAIDNLQVLCVECHKEKTKSDIALRDEYYATLTDENQMKLEEALK